MIVSQIKTSSSKVAAAQSWAKFYLGSVVTECWEEGYFPAVGCIYPYRHTHGPGFGLHWGFDFPFAYLDRLPGYHGHHSWIGCGNFLLDPGWINLNHPRCWSDSQNHICSWRACCRDKSSKNLWGSTELIPRILEGRG